MTRFLSFLILLSTAVAAVAGTLGQDLLLFGRPGWVYSGATVDMNFATGQYYGLNPSQLSVSRASSDSEVCNGQLYTFGNNVAPITPCGLWAWESRTNTIRNSVASGAVVGTPGTAPTYWSGPGTYNGVTVNASALPVVGGMQCVVYAVSGTPSATFGFQLGFDSTTASTATYGQTLTLSAYVSLSNTTNLAGGTGLVEYSITSGGAGIASHFVSFAASSTLTLVQGALTVPETNAAYVYPNYQIGLTSGQTVNLNVEFCQPQLELNPNLPATVASATVASGGVCTPGTYTFTVAGGTGTAATISGTVTGTTLGGTLTVVTPGSYSAASGLPASPATLTGGVCTTQPTVTLTPTNNAASAFATGPILTSGTAATRAQNTILSVLARPASSIFAKMTPQAPSGFPVADWSLASGGTNGLGLLTPASALTASYSAGGSTYSMGLGSFTQGTLGRFGVAYGSGAENFAFNGSSATGANSATVSGQTLYIGSNASGASPCNCSMPRIAVFPNKLSTAALGALQ